MVQTKKLVEIIFLGTVELKISTSLDECDVSSSEELFEMASSPTAMMMKPF